MDPSQTALQALIDESEALGWDSLEQFEVVEEVQPKQEAFTLIGKLLTLKPLNSQLVRGTLISAWNFAAPLAVEILAPNKFLFIIPHIDHVDRILHQGPWNIQGSLLLLQPWPLNQAIEEMILYLSFMGSGAWPFPAKHDNQECHQTRQSLWDPS